MKGQSSPNSLTEKTKEEAGAIGQNARPYYADFKESLEKDYPEFTPYLTTSELMIFQEGIRFMKWMDAAARCKVIMNYNEVYDKVPEHALEAYYERVTDEQTIWRNKRLAEKRNKHAGHDLGAREFTFTYSPKWFSDEEARKQMTRAIERLCKYYKDGDTKIIKLRAVGEVGSNGLSHVHCFYKLLGGVKITDKNFKRSYSPWDTKIKQGPSGHKGGHHASVKHESDFLGYIDKQISNAWLDVKVDAEDIN